MKPFTLFSGFIMACLVLLVILNYYDPIEKNQRGESTQNRLNEKHEPSEEFFRQRAYPDEAFDYIAYEKALNHVKTDIIEKGGSAFPGFDNEWTIQGPGNIGARVNSVVVHPTNDNIIYAGFSDGGVFKTTDGGISWLPIFDDQVFLVTGDIALDPNNPDIVYVGTGDPNISGYPSIGDGLYKSADAGSTWSHLGLTDQRIISKVAPHPSNANTLYVACMGLPFERNSDRGLYKTTDGGTTWDQVLYLNDSTGVIDVIIDPQSPETLYAATWNRIRNNQESIARGVDSKVFKSTDGGASWNQLTSGLPNSIHSRVGLVMSETNPDKLYAIYVGTDIDYEIFGIYKTEDGGNNWISIPVTELQTLEVLGGFGWYFGKIRLNPANDDEIYVLGVNMYRTNDQGLTWELVTPPWWEYSVHADKHDLVFTPSGEMLLATDGGLYSSSDGGTTWEDIEDIPATQFYRVAYNPHMPDWYYGGAQDNGSTGGNNSIITSWPRIFGGDGFQMLFHPTDPNVFYAETQRGRIWMTNDGGYANWFLISGDLAPGEQKHWDMQYIMSSANPDVLYAGAESVYRNDFPAGAVWVPVSPDLVGEGGFRSAISTISESTLNTNVLYAGTSNGKVWRTTDAGLIWDDIRPGLPDRYVSSIKASPESEDVVYVTHSGYRDNDFFSHVHRSDDRGDTWAPIASDLPPVSVNDIYILPGHADSILFVATDGGIYGSMNNGMQWERLGNNMPVIPVFDLTHNVSRNELVAGTFARGIQTFPIDSIFVEMIDPPVSTVSVFEEDFHLDVFPSPADAYVNIGFNRSVDGHEAELIITDATGRIVQRSLMARETDDALRIDVSSFPQGIYFMQLKVSNKVIPGTFSIAR